jgi:TolB-like protein
MIFSSNSSARARALGLVAMAWVVGACGHGRSTVAEPWSLAGGPVRPRIALLPVENLSGRPAPTKALVEAIELTVRAQGFEVAAGDAVKRVLAKYRVRFIGGIDVPTAKAIREELGVDAVLVSTVQLYDPVFPPKFALDMRLVSVAGPPTIVWADGVAMGGVDSPGLLGLTIVPSIEVLQAKGLAQLGTSLGAFVDAREFPTPTCSSIKPRAISRPRRSSGPGRPRVAVLPFVNQTTRRDAAEAVALELVRQLQTTGRFEVVEPGVVRSELLALRLIVEGGASLDITRVMGSSLHADILVAGYVRDYLDLPGRSGPPRVEFTVYAVDGKTGEVVWWSNSRATGEDGVIFFGLGRVSTAASLACGAARGVAERAASDRDAITANPAAFRAKGAQPAGEGARSAPEVE